MTDENTAPEAETPEAAPAAPKVERLKQNGFTRPLAGSKTGLVWDIADAISAEKQRPALRDEVIAGYKEQVPDARNGTVSTQYSRWCGFHGVQDILRKMRAEEKAEADKLKTDAKAEKAAAAAEKKETAAKAKAEKAEAAKTKKAEAAKAKAEKAAKTAADKAEKEAKAKAKAAADAAPAEE